MSIANELITRGWHQGDFVGPGGSVCLFGAVWAAHYGELPENDENLNFESLPETRALQFVACRQHQLWGSLAFWNDDPERTFDEVLRVAKEADEILDRSR